MAKKIPWSWLLCVLAVLAITVVIPLGLQYYTAHRLTTPQPVPEAGQWYILHPEGTKTADGEAMPTRVRVGSENKLIVYFLGGGMSTDANMAAHPYQGIWLGEGFYSNDLSGQLPMVCQLGLADSQADNPFRDWSVIVVPYTTADFHVGDGEFVYTDENGEKKTLYHHGYQNYRAVMDMATQYVGAAPEELLIAGYSAGGFAATMLAEELMTDYFPQAAHVTVCVDSSVLVLDNWQEILCEVWHAPESVTEKCVTGNPVTDGLTALYERYGDSLSYLYLGSVRDGALAQYQAYYDEGTFFWYEDNIPAYSENLKGMLSDLQENVPTIGIYLFDNLPYSKFLRGSRLTQHTVLATNGASLTLSEGIRPLDWLYEATCGRVSSVGLDKLDG